MTTFIDATVGPALVLDTGENTAEAARLAGIATDAAATSEIARDVAITAGPHYATIAAGEAATTTGQTFAVAPGDGTLTWRRRTSGGSTQIFEGLTKAAAATKAELAAGNVPVAANLTGFPAINKTLGDALPYINPGEFFGIRSDGVTNDTTALRAAIEAISNNSAAPGGMLNLRPGGQTRTEDEVVIEPGVRLNINGGEVLPHLDGGAVAGLVPMSDAWIMNGAIRVTSLGNPGTQAGAHAPIRVGPPASDAGTIASPSALLGAKRWRLLGLTLESDKDVITGEYPNGVGASAIQLYGDVGDGIIDGITVPSSAVMYAWVSADWIPLGPIISDQASMAANKTAYQGGTAKTLHPHGVAIRNIFGGALSRTANNLGDGSIALRMSGCRDFTVSHVRGQRATTAFVLVTAGDLGFEFADPELRERGMGLIRLHDIEAVAAMLGNPAGEIGWLGYFDGLADNVRRAVEENGYTAMADTRVAGVVEVSGLSGRGDGGANAQDGVRFNNIDGFELSYSTLRGFKRGVFMDEGARNGRVFGNEVFSNRSHGILAEHGTIRPESIEIFDNHVHSNGTSGTAAGLFIGDSLGLKIYGNRFGTRAVRDATQAWGLRVDGGNISQLEIGVPRQNVVESTVVDGVGESVLSDAGADLRKVTAWQSARVANDALTSIARAGLSLWPKETRRDSDGVIRSHFRASPVAAPGGIPASGTYVAGETLEVETTGVRTRCTASGSPGTWV